MIRTAFITPALYWGGAERWMLTLARESARELDWVGCAVIEEMFLSDNMVSEMGQYMPVWGYGHDAVERVMPKADVLISWGLSSIESLTRRWRIQRRGPLVFVGHGSGQFDRNAMRAAGKCASHWVVVSEACVPAITEECPHAPVQVIENGIDAQRCVPGRSREEVRRELGIAPHEFAVGYFGRLVPEKNPVGLARAVACLPDRFRGVWIGDGWDMENQRAAIRAILPSAIFRDRVDSNIGDYLRALDVFVLVSPAEGFSMAFLEACYAGVPTIMTPVGVMPELERRHGRHWEVVPVKHTPQQLAEAIVRMSQWSDEFRQQRIASAKRIVEQNHLASHMAARWCRFLERACETWKVAA